MSHQKFSQKVFGIGLIFLFLVGCSAPATPTPIPIPTPTLMPTLTPAPATGQLEGRVFWGKTDVGIYLFQIGLTLDEKEYFTATTDDKGYYSIEGLEPGTYYVSLSWFFDKVSTPCTFVSTEYELFKGVGSFVNMPHDGPTGEIDVIGLTVEVVPGMNPSNIELACK